jgi:hypothetical protein
LDFWRKIIPSRTYPAKEKTIMPELKALKERLTLLLRANAAKKFNLKPLLMYHYENPRHLLTS